MKYESIADIYSANEKIREGFFAMLNTISPDEATMRPDGEKWSIAEIVEHVSLVENGISRICSKLVADSQTNALPPGETPMMSDAVLEKLGANANTKLEAPERVQPTGNVSIPESLEFIKRTHTFIHNLRPGCEQFDLGANKFPHPYFGDLTATEWLILIGGHESRHSRQIMRILETIRQ